MPLLLMDCFELNTSLQYFIRAVDELSQQVKRKGSQARKKHSEMVEMGRRMMKDKPRKELLEGMLVDNTNFNSDDNGNSKNKGESLDKPASTISSASEEERRNPNEVKESDLSEDSSDDSSSEDEEEDSSSSDDDDDNSDEEDQRHRPQSHQYSPGNHQHRSSHPSGIPGPSQFQNPPFPPHLFQNAPFPPHQLHQNMHYQSQWQQQQQQANMAWYQNWCASVQLQRQQVANTTTKVT